VSIFATSDLDEESECFAEIPPKKQQACPSEVESDDFVSVATTRVVDITTKEFVECELTFTSMSNWIKSGRLVDGCSYIKYNNSKLRIVEAETGAAFYSRYTCNCKTHENCTAQVSSAFHPHTYFLTICARLRLSTVEANGQFSLGGSTMFRNSRT